MLDFKLKLNVSKPEFLGQVLCKRFTPMFISPGKNNTFTINVFISHF